MTRIMAHMGGSRQYRSILRHLHPFVDNNNCLVANFHRNIFDNAYVFKPDIFIFPAMEYTQEIHNFVNDTQNIRVFLYLDTEVPQKELVDFWNAKCQCIINGDFEPALSKSLRLKNIYDDNVFYDMEMERNDKIAVSLSGDMDKNNHALKNVLYPEYKNKKIVLFNNPQFQHVQNIGIYNEPDLNYVMNTYAAFVDIDNEFAIEADVCKIPKLDISVNLLDAIENDRKITPQETEKYKCSDFVKDQLLPYLRWSVHVSE